MLNHLDLFSGIGGFSRALELAKVPIQNRYFSEIEEYANKVYQKNYPEARPLGDVRSIDGTALRAAHPGPWLVTGGFPCQDISSVGKRAGITGPRSGLWHEMHRIISELRPEFVLIENVAALLYRGLDTVLRSLAQIGYDAEWEIISAEDVGAPHLRKRIWIQAWPTPDAKVFRCEADSKLSQNQRDMGDMRESDRPIDRPGTWLDWEGFAARSDLSAVTIIPRMDDGICDKLDINLRRVKSLGNAIVPQVAATIFRRWAQSI